MERCSRRRPSSVRPVSGHERDGAAAIEARGLSKSFDGRAALRDVSFTARAGELLAVIGPNGAGKTTLLSILAGIRGADAGTLSVPGEVGWVPQGAALYRRLTVAENLRLFARLERVADVEGGVERMLEQARLAERRDDQVATLSGGNQQRVNIAIGLLSEPAVLLLDEPSTGLDPRQRARLWEFVLDLAGAGTTVIYSTHHLHEAERYGSRLLVLADGERVFDGTSAELHAAVGGGEHDFESAFVAFLRERGH
ncbi:MAG: ATP-binding cassette domain-containing protein [Solirubrobacterales bacterium]|nr:ATP-binding cassette domain-containing protein [Solirubrobacterales bacterium]